MDFSNISNLVQNNLDYCNSICMTNSSCAIPELACSAACFTATTIAAPLTLVATTSAIGLKGLGLLTFDSKNFPYHIPSILFVAVPASIATILTGATTVGYAITYFAADTAWFNNIMGNATG